MTMNISDGNYFDSGHVYDVGSGNIGHSDVVVLETLQAFQTRLASVESQNEFLSNTVSSLQIIVLAFMFALVGVSSFARSQGKEILFLKTNNDTLTKKVETLENEVEVLNGRITRSTKKVDTLKKEVEMLNGRITRSNLARLDQDKEINALKRNVVELKAEGKTHCQDNGLIAECLIMHVNGGSAFDDLLNDALDSRSKATEFEVSKLVQAYLYETTVVRHNLPSHMRMKKGGAHCRGYGGLTRDRRNLEGCADVFRIHPDTQKRLLHNQTLLKLKPFFDVHALPRHRKSHLITVLLAPIRLRALRGALLAFIDLPDSGFDENEKDDIRAAFPTTWDEMVPTFAMLQNDATIDTKRRVPNLDATFDPKGIEKLEKNKMRAALGGIDTNVPTTPHDRPYKGHKAKSAPPRFPLN